MNNRILLATTFCGFEANGRDKPTVEDKLLILQHCMTSMRESGADKIALMLIGPSSFARRLRRFSWLQDVTITTPDNSLRRNPGLHMGDRRAIHHASLVARHCDCDWLVKVGGDCFFPEASWARYMVFKAMQGPFYYDFVACDSKNDSFQTKCFASTPDFIFKTLPLDKEVESKFLERAWFSKVAAKGLLSRWLPLESTLQYESRIMYWWSPTERSLRFFHTHIPSVSATWRMEKTP